jgi:small subunit ribosomal protein S6
MMRFYELVLLVRQDSDVNRTIDALLEFAKEKSPSFKVVKSESWGLRKLSYPIDNEKHANYVLLGLESDVHFLTDLKKKIESNIVDFLRHLFIRVDQISEKRSPILDSDMDSRFAEKPRSSSSSY